MRNFKSISIIIPVYNEEETISEIITRVLATDTLGLKKELVIVDDGSKDGTVNILNKIKNNNIKIIIKDVNAGKGAALKTGFENCTGDIILIQDADFEYKPEEYPLLLEPIVNNGADVVYGSRFLTNRPHRILYYWHSVGNRFITWVSNVMTDLNLSDMETCYKVFTREILDQILPRLRSKRFGFEPEFTAKVAHLKPRPHIFEVGISYVGRTYQEGKKIGWKDGVEAIYTIIKYNIFR